MKKTDGSLWMWGSNDNGLLGEPSSPSSDDNNLIGGTGAALFLKKKKYSQRS